VRKVIFLLIVSLLGVVRSIAQSPNATINGLVFDPTGAAIAGAEVVVINDATGVQYTTKTNGDGIYVVPNLPPGPYRIQVSNSGFKTIIKPDIIIHVQDALAINFTLPIGAASEVVTVKGSASFINTENAAVSTVVDRTYVENMPLNGRSFQDLILLTPGVVTNSPQSTSAVGLSGEFSVNGQRGESNYYTVDGVSANIGIYTFSTSAPANSGSLPASTALGTTQGLVSVDALEEFRVQSSTYSAEFGRNPGGQFSFVTRSGTNQWHGTAFDYLRNNVFDANDWFNNYNGQPEAAERQNDFGGTLGGPFRIPRLYNGKDKTFFYFSYEGLRLEQPQAASVIPVPNATLRQNTPTPLQAVLNAFPVANGSDLGNGVGQFIGAWSNPGSLDATSVRLDHTINDKLRLFFRFSNTSSTADAHNMFLPSLLDSSAFTTRTYTLGATSSFSNRFTNEFRLNRSSNEAVQARTPINFAGATAVNLSQLQGFARQAKPAPFVEVFLNFPGHLMTIGQLASSAEQKQWNIVDILGMSAGRHQLKFGFDFRRLEPSVFEFSPLALYQYFSSASVQANSVDFGLAISFGPAFPVYTNFSAFAQDEWRLTPRLNLSMGLRWEVNPAPGAAKGNLPYTVQGNSLSALTLAPQGTPLWKTSWYNFAPRLGVAYVLRSAAGYETVVRGGGGVFFDTGQQLGSSGYSGDGFAAGPQLFGRLFGSPASFPLPPSQVNPVIVNPPVAPFNTIIAFPPHLQLPFTLQWNASLEQALGKSQTLTVSYVGANGRRLLEASQVNAHAFNPAFHTIVFDRNGLTSDYSALQVKFQRGLAHGLHALASYTWSHAIDYGSQDSSLPYRRGNSDFDVRHSFSSAFSYDLPNAFQNGFARAVLHHWGLDDRLTARTSFPVPLQGNLYTDLATGQQFFGGLDILPRQPVYIRGSQCAALYNNGKGCPGDRAINPTAFTFPASGQTGDAPRNFLRGFGAWQMDLAIRREFPIYERLKLQFRAEAFNIFNHPNFGTIQSIYCSPKPGSGCVFGQAQFTLAQSLGTLNRLYQTGGPRSMQFALKLAF
jgi:Carboxypeptidase regulatory-like domain/TonB dependent receptor